MQPTLCNLGALAELVTSICCLPYLRFTMLTSLSLFSVRVTIEGQLGPGAPKQSARLSLVRELSIMGLGNPLQVGSLTTLLDG